MRPYGGGAVRRELGSGRTTLDVQLANQPAGLFQIDGIMLPQDAAIGEAGLLFQTARFGFSLGYVGRRWSEHSRHTVRLGVGF